MQNYPPPPQGTPTQGHGTSYPPTSNVAGGYAQHGSPVTPMHLPPNQSPQFHTPDVSKPPPVASSLQGNSAARAPAQPTYHPPPATNLGSNPVVLVCGQCNHRGPTTVTSDNCTLVNWMCRLIAFLIIRWNRFSWRLQISDMVGNCLYTFCFWYDYGFVGTLCFCLCCFFLFPGTAKHTHTCSNCGAYLGSNNMV